MRGAPAIGLTGILSFAVEITLNCEKFKFDLKEDLLKVRLFTKIYFKVVCFLEDKGDSSSHI